MKTNDQPAKRTAPGEIEIVRLLPGPIERAWEYLGDPEKRARWFTGGAIEPHVGGKVELFFRHKDIAPDETPPEHLKTYHDPGETMFGKVLRWEPPRILSYSFSDDSDVTFELTQQGAKVMLVLTHRSRGEDLPYVTDFAAGWHLHLLHLVAQMEGTPRPPFWPLHLKLKTDYHNLLADSI